MTRGVACNGTYEIFYTMRGGACGAAAHVVAPKAWRHGAEERIQARWYLASRAVRGWGSMGGGVEAMGRREVVGTKASHH